MLKAKYIRKLNKSSLILIPEQESEQDCIREQNCINKLDCINEKNCSNKQDCVNKENCSNKQDYVNKENCSNKQTYINEKNNSNKQDCINGINCVNIRDSIYEQDCIEMFRYNEIPYFLNMEQQKQDMKFQYCYDITGKRSLEQLLEYKTLDFEMLQSILNSLDQACIQTEDFMMTENDILLEPEYVFADYHAECMNFCYLPGNQKNICMQFQAFMEYLLQQLDHKDEQAVQLGYGVYQSVVEERIALHKVLGDKKHIQELYRISVEKKTEEEEQISTEQFSYKNKSDLDGIQHHLHSDSYLNIQSNVHSNMYLNPHFIEQRQVKLESENSFMRKTDQITKVRQKESLRNQAAERLKRMLRKKIYTDKTGYSEENTVFDADEEEIQCSHPTVCLMPETEELQNQFVYQGADRSRDFHCIQGRMLIGSNKEESDIYIPFPMVSRVHASVEIDTEGTFLEDLNSTNGTHVNGELLQYREKRMLQKGDIISLAGECYSFH